MEVVSDAASIAAARLLSKRLGRRVGGSTGTNFVACARIASEMAARAEAGSIVSILCDSGDRYASTLFNETWLSSVGIEIAPEEARLETFFATGKYT
jgi:cysteine synthase A